MLKAEFYIDDVLYTGEVKSSVVNAQERFWINDTSMSVGSKKIKVVVTYDKGFGETGTVELEKTLEVLNKDWNRLTFKMDRSLSNVKYFIYDSVNNSYSRVYGVERNGDTATITITKDIYDHPENYILCVTCNQGFLYQVMNTEMDFDLAKCHILTFVTADHMSLSSVTIKSFDGRSFDNTSYSSTMMLTPGLYSFDVTFYYFDEYRRVSVDVDLAAEDQTIDLSQYITKFMFRFTDGAPVETDVQLFYKNSEDDAWNSLYLDSDLNDTDLICAVPSYYADLLTSVSDAVVCVKTEDSAYAINALPIREVSKNTITLRKNDLQKYTVSASADEADFDVLEVRVSCDKFSLSFYTTTIYLTPDAYEITVFCKDKDLEDVFETKAVLSEDRIIKVDWAAGYLEKDAYVYALDSTGVAFTKPAVKTGDFINVQRSVYQVKTNLIRNDSYYTVESYVDTTEQNADLFIGDAFSGVITNSFGTYKEGASLTLYLDQLYDNNGNKLTYFNSQNEEDNLSGFVVLTNKANTEDIKYIPVSLSSLSSFTVELPEGPGEYAVSIDLSTNSDLIHPIEVPNVESISLNVDEITLNCKQTYQLELVVSPSEAEMPKVIWASSDDSVASVDETGLIQTSNLKRGSATITAQTEDGSMLAQCKVTVKFTLLQWIVWFVTGGLVKDIFNKLKAMVKA